MLALAALAGASALVSAQAPTVGSGPGAAPRFVAIGCLTKQAGASGAAAQCVVTDRRGDSPTVYRLGGDLKLFEQHVGHEVEAAGSIDRATGASTRPLLKVVSVVYIARTCAKR
jgi:hypothetical protein